MTRDGGQWPTRTGSRPSSDTDCADEFLATFDAFEVVPTRSVVAAVGEGAEYPGRVRVTA